MDIIRKISCMFNNDNFVILGGKHDCVTDLMRKYLNLPLMAVLFVGAHSRSGGILFLWVSK